MTQLVRVGGNLKGNHVCTSCDNVTLLPPNGRQQAGGLRDSFDRQIKIWSHEICPIITTFTNHDTHSKGTNLPHCLKASFDLSVNPKTPGSTADRTD